MSSSMAHTLLVDRVVVVTGSSTGIGRGIAICAAQNGADLVLHHLGSSTEEDVKEVQLRIAELGRRAVTVAGDISKPETSAAIVETAVATFGRIDGLVSNAGICPFHPFLTLPHDLWRTVHDVNLSGAFYVVQAVANQMATQPPSASTGQRGSIVAISSISAQMGGGEQAHYTPTKAGVKSLMESCAIALGPLAIRCNSIMPGTIETNINKDDLSDPAKRADQTKRVPIGRLGVPEDIAGPTIFMLSDMAQYVNGAGLLVDGGMAISLQ